MLIMKNITAADALKLPIPERIQLVEDIWDTIALASDSIELTEKEKEIIDKRLDAYHKNPEMGSQWSNVYKRIAGKR